MNRLPDRIRKQISIVDGDACWEWIGLFFKDGYPQIRHEGKTTRAHRLIYRLCIGDFPNNLCVLHRCDNPKCVRPDHLFVGTVIDNRNDCVSKGRQARGSKNGGGGKLNDDQVREILSLRSAGIGIVELGKRFGVHFATIAKISRREIWKHVEQ